jgi:hypothetical protein
MIEEEEEEKEIPARATPFRLCKIIPGTGWRGGLLARWLLTSRLGEEDSIFQWFMITTSGPQPLL